MRTLKCSRALTVGGKVKARLVRAAPVGDDVQMETWAEELSRLQALYGTGRNELNSEDILREDREARLRVLGHLRFVEALPERT